MGYAKKLFIKIISKIFPIKIFEYFFLKNKYFSILSNNCWGYELYSTIGCQYNTPCVGLFMYPNDFLNFLLNIDYYISTPLTMADFDNDFSYPIAKIKDIRIHFLHYENNQSAIDKWNRRCLRLKEFKQKFSNQHLIVKICNRDSVIDDNLLKKVIERFPKIIIFNDLNYCSVLTEICSNKILNGRSLYKYRIVYYLKFIKLFKGL